MTYRHSYDPTGCDCCGNVGRDLMFDGKGFVCAECMNSMRLARCRYDRNEEEDE